MPPSALIQLLLSCLRCEAGPATAASSRVRVIELEPTANQIARVPQHRAGQKSGGLWITDNFNALKFLHKVTFACLRVQPGHIFESAAPTALYSDSEKNVRTPILGQEPLELLDCRCIDLGRKFAHLQFIVVARCGRLYKTTFDSAS